MSNRIFPTTETQLGSEKEFNGIKFDDLMNRLATAQEEGDARRIKPEVFEIIRNQREASDKAQESAEPEEFNFESAIKLAQLNKIMKDQEFKVAGVNSDENDAYDDDTREAAMNAGFRKWLDENGKGKKKEDGDDEKADEDCDDCDEEDKKAPMVKKSASCACGKENCSDCGKRSAKINKCKGCGKPDFVCVCGEEEKPAKSEAKDAKPGKEAKAQSEGVIRFTSPQQISADAIYAAEANGDERLKTAILAARRDQREMLASRIIEAAQANMGTKRVAKKRGYSMTVVAEKTQKSAPKTASGFKSPARLTTKERSVVAQRLVSEGFPAQYISQILGEGKNVISAAEKQIREVGASNMPDATKRVVVAGMLKEATLDSAQLGRCDKYWIEELGYDADWVHDLFSSKYDKKSASSKSGDKTEETQSE